MNGQNTRDGGTHLAAYREAIAKTLKEFFKKDYAPEDVRQGVIGAISIRIQEPNFEGQTKTKLGSTYTYEREVVDEKGNPVKEANGANRIERGPTIRAFINDFVKTNLDNYLHIHKEIVPTIQNTRTRFHARFMIASARSSIGRAAMSSLAWAMTGKSRASTTTHSRSS